MAWRDIQSIKSSFVVLPKCCHDSALAFIAPRGDGFLELAVTGDLPDSHGGKLTRLVPRLRNRYFHGTPLMSIEWIFVALQLREISDALRTRQE